MEQHKYVTLSNQIKNDIENGKYNVGSKLPSENELTLLTGLSRQTVRQAIGVLELEGIVERSRGSGTYVKKYEQKKTSTRNIAIVTTYIGEYIFPTILKGIEQELAENNYTSMLAATQNRVDNERRIIRDFMQKSIDGLIVEGTKTALPNPNIDLYQKLQDMGIPVVFFNGYYNALRNPVYVVTDDKKAGQQACRYLVEKGHKKIAGIFKSDDQQGHGRYAGVALEAVSNNVTLSDENILWFNTENQEEIIDNFALDTIGNCSAVVCYNDNVAVKVIQKLSSIGKEVPKDMAIISFDYSTYAEIASPKITSFNHPKEDLGRMAAKKLLYMIDGAIEKPLIMPWDIVEQDSV